MHQQEIILRETGEEFLHSSKCIFSSQCGCGYLQECLEILLHVAGEFFLALGAVTAVKRPVAIPCFLLDRIERTNPVVDFCFSHARSAPRVNAIVEKIETQECTLFGNAQRCHVPALTAGIVTLDLDFSWL